MKIVLDTNVLSELMKPQGSQKVKNWVATQAKIDLFVTFVFFVPSRFKNLFEPRRREEHEGNPSLTTCTLKGLIG